MEKKLSDNAFFVLIEGGADDLSTVLPVELESSLLTQKKAGFPDSG